MQQAYAGIPFASGCKAIRLAVALMILWAVAGLQVSGAAAQTLPEALKQAYRLHPQIKAEQAQQRITDELMPRALSGWRPTVISQVNLAAKNSNENSNSMVHSKPLGFSVRLEQPIFRGFRTVSATKQADQLIAAQRQNLILVEQTVMLEAIRAYMDVIRDREILRLRRNQQKLLHNEWRGTKRRFDLGGVTRTDVAQARARHNDAVANVSGAEADLAVSVGRYMRQVGDKPGVLARPRLSRRLPRSLNHAMKQAEQYNPEIIKAMHKEVAARHFVNVKRGELLPKVSLEAEYDYTHKLGSSFDDVETAAVRGVITVPLYQSGTVYSSIREARQQVERRRMLILTAHRKIREQTIRTWSRFKEMGAKMQSVKRQIGAAMVAVQGVRTEVLTGTRTTLEVLDAERELMNARIKLELLRREQIVRAYEIIAATGHLTAYHLGLSVATYDPHAYLNTVRDRWFGAGISVAE